LIESPLWCSPDSEREEAEEKERAGKVEVLLQSFTQVAGELCARNGGGRG
jgi:hypothetical protein